MKENKLRFHLDNDLPLVSTRLWKIGRAHV